MRFVFSFVISFFVCLLLIEAAKGASLNEVASFAAQKPIRVQCDADRNIPEPLRGIGFIHGWAKVNSNEIHLHPTHCRQISLNPRNPALTVAFATSLGILLHESRHAAGILSESCAELYAQLGVFDVVRRFWSVQFHTPLSLKIGQAVHSFNVHALGPRYRPRPDSCL